MIHSKNHGLDTINNQHSPVISTHRLNQCSSKTVYHDGIQNPAKPWNYSVSLRFCPRNMIKFV